MNIHKLVIIPAGIFAALVSASATAGFILEQPSVAADRSTPMISPYSPDAKAERARAIAGMGQRQKIDLDAMLTSRISQTGTVPDQIPYIRGIGKSVTVADALKQILPSGWRAYYEGDLDLNANTDWYGSRSWVMALHGVLVATNMRAQIDWANKELTLFPSPEKVLGKNIKVDSSKAMAVAELLGRAKKAEYGYDGKVAPEEMTWELLPSKSLRDNLKGWAETAKWKLVWKAVEGSKVIDYPIEAKVTFTGDLVGKTGALARVIAAYADADYPLEVEFFRDNRVVEVRLHRADATHSK